MRAGELREQVTIQRRLVARDAYGAEVVSWEDAATVWASAEPISGREYVSMRQSQSDVSTRFRTHWLANVDSTMRLLWRGTVYQIAEAINVEARDRELEILCVAETTAATTESDRG